MAYYFLRSPLGGSCTGAAASVGPGCTDSTFVNTFLDTFKLALVSISSRTRLLTHFAAQLNHLAKTTLALTSTISELTPSAPVQRWPCICPTLQYTPSCSSAVGAAMLPFVTFILRSKISPVVSLETWCNLKISYGSLCSKPQRPPYQLVASPMQPDPSSRSITKAQARLRQVLACSGSIAEQVPKVWIQGQSASSHSTLTLIHSAIVHKLHTTISPRMCVSSS